MLTPRRRAKIDREIRKIRSRHRWGCWVCGTGASIKTSRMSVGVRCKKCMEEGKTIPDILALEKLLAEIELGHKPRAEAL